jgi:hypothetical protein
VPEVRFAEILADRSTFVVEKRTGVGRRPREGKVSKETSSSPLRASRSWDSSSRSHQLTTDSSGCPSVPRVPASRHDVATRSSLPGGVDDLVQHDVHLQEARRPLVLRAKRGPLDDEGAMEGGGPVCGERGRFLGSRQRSGPPSGDPRRTPGGVEAPSGDRGVRSAGYRPAVESRSSPWISCDAGSVPRLGRGP